MDFKSVRLDFMPGKGEALWLATAKNKYGLHCEFDPLNASSASVQSWNLGQAFMTSLDVAGQTLSPVDEGHPAWPGEHFLVQLVVSGRVHLEQCGERLRLAAGSLFLVDPARRYLQSFPARARVLAMRLPKAGLLVRGARYRGGCPMLFDQDSADVLASRELNRHQRPPRTVTMPELPNRATAPA